MAEQEYTVVRNGVVLTPLEEIKDGVVVIRESRILGVGRRGEVQEPPDAALIDAGGGYIAPGMIDIHVHGGKGADVMDATPEAL